MKIKIYDIDMKKCRTLHSVTVGVCNKVCKQKMACTLFNLYLKKRICHGIMDILKVGKVDFR